jgi:alkylhydroperoxidase family enzyme
VPEGAYAPVAAFLDAPQLVALTAFGAMMIATNIVNNALEVELDEYLYRYRGPAG